MAGAPNDDRERARLRATLLDRVRRLAWFGWGALVAGIAALALGLGWLASHASHAPGSAPDEVDVAAPLPALPPGNALPDREAMPESVRRYLDSTVYPPSMGRLTPDHGDLLDPNRRFEDFRPILETKSPDPNEIVAVRLTSDRYYYEGDDPIGIELGVRRGSDPIEPLSLDAGATREGRAGLEGRRAPLRFVREGDDYRAQLDPARFADHHGPILVDVRVEYDRGVFHDETMRLFLTPEGRIPARFTGEVEDRVANGHLVVDVGIDVEVAGQYRIDANLYDADGAPIAFSAFKGRLDGSARVVPIQFFGRLLRDVGRPGPYRIGEVRGYRFLDGAYPDRERMPDLPGTHVTRAIALDRFSTDEFVDAHKLQMVQLLLEDEARGIGMAPPPIATPETPPESAPAPSDPPTPAADARALDPTRP